MAHEDLNRKPHLAGSSDRAFGVVIAGVCLLLALGPLRHGHPPRWWAFAVAGAFALIAMLKPVLLATPNRWWTQLGVLLGKVVSPIALGILFYAVLTPVAMILRFTGQDPLRLKLDRHSDSYWMAREPPGPPPDSMGNQF
ncbi:MAG TPA: SxtJ family membrane protein [Steroidobacteraceae bacterium]|nr:SxtJ family membrane protein [Steroidobacteraceae bacterium]